VELAEVFGATDPCCDMLRAADAANTTAARKWDVKRSGFGGLIVMGFRV
jgi:hypothetical protein